MGRDEAGEGPEKTEKPVFLENTGFLLVRPEGFEPPAFWSVGIRLFDLASLEPQLVQDFYFWLVPHLYHTIHPVVRYFFDSRTLSKVSF